MEITDKEIYRLWTDTQNILEFSRSLEERAKRHHRNTVLDEVIKAMQADTFVWGGQAQQRVNADYWIAFVNNRKEEE